MLTFLRVSTSTYSSLAHLQVTPSLSPCVYSRSLAQTLGPGEGGSSPGVGRTVNPRLMGSRRVSQSTFFCPLRRCPRGQSQPELCSLPAAGVVLDPARPGLLRFSAHHHRELAASRVPPHSRRGRRPLLRRRACARAVVLTRCSPAAGGPPRLPFQSVGSPRQGLRESRCAPVGIKGISSDRFAVDSSLYSHG